METVVIQLSMDDCQVVIAGLDTQIELVIKYRDEFFDKWLHDHSETHLLAYHDFADAALSIGKVREKFVLGEVRR